jgi:exopolysaccharide production protein ExoZ
MTATLMLPTSTRQSFRSLEVGRGIAATMVALAHAASMTAQPRWFGVTPLRGTLANMGAGVDFFFVLSGFVITFVHWDDFGCPERLGHYARRRFTRIIPPYWIILTVIVPIYLLVPSFGETRQHDWISVVTSYLLMPMPDQPVLGVAWTLTYELLFYILLGVTICLGRRVVPVFVLWFGSIVVCQIFDLRSYPASFFGNTWGLEFMLGMGCAILFRHRRIPVAGHFLVLGLVFFFGTTFCALDIQGPAGGSWARLVFGPAAALILLGSVELERSRRLVVPKWLLPLGAASYAIYLTHVVTESALMHIAIGLGARSYGADIVVVLLAMAGVAVGFGYHFAIELPSTGWTRRLLEGQTSDLALRAGKK